MALFFYSFGIKYTNELFSKCIKREAQSLSNVVTTFDTTFVCSFF